MPSGFDQWAADLDRAANRGRELDSLLPQLDLVLRDACHVEQVVHESDHLPDLALHHLDGLAERRRVGLCPAQDLQAVADRRERVPELMGEQRQEVCLPPVGFLQLLLGALLVVDVGIRADPLHDASGSIVNGDTPAQEPAVRAVRGAPQSELRLELRPGSVRRVPPIHHPLEVVGVDHMTQVFGVGGLLPGQAGVLAPARVYILGPSLGVRRPDHLRTALGEDAEPGLAHAQAFLALPACRLRLLVLGDVDACPGHIERPTLLVFEDLPAVRDPVDAAVRPPHPERHVEVGPLAGTPLAPPAHVRALVRMNHAEELVDGARGLSRGEAEQPVEVLIPFQLARLDVPQEGAGARCGQGGRQTALAPSQRLFDLLPLGDVAGRSGDGLHGTARPEDRDEDVLVLPFADRTREGRLVAQRLLRLDDLQNLALQARGQLRRIVELEEVLPERLGRVLLPECEEPTVDEREPPVEVEDVVEVGGVRESGLVHTALLLGCRSLAGGLCLDPALLRAPVLGHVHTRRDDVDDLARLVLDGRERKIHDALAAVRHEVGRFAAERLAGQRLGEPGFDPGLQCGRAIPPTRLPEWLADDVVPGETAALERGAIGVDHRSVGCQETGEQSLIEDRPVLRVGLPQLAVRLLKVVRSLDGLGHVLDAVKNAGDLTRRAENWGIHRVEVALGRTARRVGAPDAVVADSDRIGGTAGENSRERGAEASRVFEEYLEHAPTHDVPTLGLGRLEVRVTGGRDPQLRRQYEAGLGRGFEQRAEIKEGWSIGGARRKHHARLGRRHRPRSIGAARRTLQG